MLYNYIDTYYHYMTLCDKLLLKINGDNNIIIIMIVHIV